MTLHAWLLGIFLVVGTLLRIQGLGDHGLWIDEYGTWWAMGDSVADCIDRVLAIHGQSPLYYLLVRASVALGGTDVVAFRLPSLLSGIGLLALSYPLALRIFQDRHAALLSVAAFALNDRLIYYSQEARPYGLALLCAAASFHFYASLLQRGGRRAWWSWVGATLLTFYVHYLFGIILAVQAAHLLIRRPWAGGRVRPWVGAFVLLGVAMLPGLWQLFALFARRESIDWITTPSGPLASVAMAGDLLDPIALAAICGLALFAWIRQRSDAVFPGPGHPGIAVLWFVLPLVVYAVVAPLAGISLLTGRYVAAVVPGAALIHGWLLAVPRGPRARWLPLAVFVCLVGVLRVGPLVSREGGPFWWFFQHGWQAAAEELVDGYRDGDLILFRTGFVEIGDLVRGRASPETTEFVEWPLLAHLPAGRSFNRLPLPYRDTPEMRTRMAAALQEAAPIGRLWVVGLDPDDDTGLSFGGLDAMVQHGRGFRGVGQHHYGLVHLLQYEPRAASAAPGSRNPSDRP